MWLYTFIKLYFLLAFPNFALSVSSTRPNFVVIVTDDQDIFLEGMIPMIKTKNLIGKNGVDFSNMFVTNPLCCPSRASILTGLYSHNHGVVNNSLSGNCNSLLWQRTFEKHTLATYLKKAGYTTFYSGKYLNEYGAPSAGGVKHIPHGWNEWAALVGNSVYYNYTISVNGKEETHGDNSQKDYLTDVIADKSVKFLSRQNGSKPFFMMVSPPAPHAPFTPAPWYEKRFTNLRAPRTPNFNIPGGKTKHWLVRQPPNPLPEDVIFQIDEVFKNRWRTLLSVDDIVERIFQTLVEQDLLKNTFIFFTSDNGFHLGQFSLPWDKRQPYETDIRVPLLIKGPGIKPGLVIDKPVLHIDIMPTVLDMANIRITNQVDGQSLLPLLNAPEKVLWRTGFLVEHRGEASNESIKGCPQYRPEEVNVCEVDCICDDSKNNTYTCIRMFSAEDNSLKCVFLDNEHFVEVYNIAEDPFQMKNLHFEEKKFPAHN